MSDKCLLVDTGLRNITSMRAAKQQITNEIRNWKSIAMPQIHASLRDAAAASATI